MINQDLLEKLVESIKESPQGSPCIERWLDRIEELQKDLVDRVVSLCRFTEEIPQTALPIYADMLISVLEDKSLEIDIDSPVFSPEKISNLVKLLEDLGETERASRILELL